MNDLSDHKGMTAFLAAGTRTFVDLTEPSELKHYEAIARNTAQSMGIDPLSLTFYRHPIQGCFCNVKSQGEDSAFGAGVGV
ncbi:MAG: hypothetical protein R3F31_25260 [Verrucomicrobiales bacterium]